MNIAFLIDNSYAEQLCVTLASVLKNDKYNTFFNIYVLDGGISDKNKEKICRLKDFKPFNIEFIKIDISLFDKSPVRYHLKALNYARILLPSLLTCDKVLFLDCDLLVLDDLTDFYNEDFENKYACVVKERLSDESFFKRHIKELRLKSYFNAGVMLLNLEKMRKHNIQELCFKFLSEQPDKIVLLDQCVLNFAFNDNVKFIATRYNYQYKLNVSKKIKNPAIIHFVGKEKPYFGYAHPYENMYYHYLKLTPFRISFFEFKQRMWKMFYPKFIKRIFIIQMCML